MLMERYLTGISTGTDGAENENRNNVNQQRNFNLNNENQGPPPQTQEKSVEELVRQYTSQQGGVDDIVSKFAQVAAATKGM